MGLDLAASLSVASNWSLALEVQARDDRHDGSATIAADRGSFIRSRGYVRGHVPLRPGLEVGGQLLLMLPAASTAVDALAGIGGAIDALLTARHGNLQLGARLGLRRDRGFRSLYDPSALSIADRVALDVSQYPELRLGLALTMAALGLCWGAEWTWDVAIGSGAPAALDSPMWLRGGPVFAIDRFQLSALLGVNLSGRPTLSVDQPLARVEPRLFVGLQIASRWDLSRVANEAASPTLRPQPEPAPEWTVEVIGWAEQPVAAALVSHGAQRCETDDGGQCTLPHTPDLGRITVTAADYLPMTLDVPAPAEREPRIPIHLQAAPLTLRGVVRDHQGAPLPAARLSVMYGDRQEETLSDDHGRFAVPDLEPGELLLRIESPQIAITERPITLVPNASPVDLVADPLVPVGQLRGRIRALDGQPLQASIVIMPGGRALRSDPQGEFVLELAAGDYTVSLAAAGYLSQTRDVQVEPRGVVVLLVDLRDDE